MKKLLIFLLLLLFALPALAESEAPVFAGSPTILLGEPQFVIELGDAEEVYMPLDDLGRVAGASAIISEVDSSPRTVISQFQPSGWQQASYPFISGLNLYNRSHLLAHQLGGNDIGENIFTGTQYVNYVAMLPIENAIAEYIQRTGHRVRYECIPYFAGENLVCSGVYISAQSIEDDEIAYRLFCFNVQPGVAIDYTNGLSSIAGTETTIEAPEATATPAEDGTAEVHYVLNTNTRRFHRPSCPSVEDMKAKNKKDYYGTRDALIDMGYKPCGRCNP